MCLMVNFILNKYYKYVTIYNGIVQYHIKLNPFQWCQQILFIDNFPCILKKKLYRSKVKIIIKMIKIIILIHAKV